MAEWHGWRVGNVQLSIAPHPQNARVIGLIFSVGDDVRVVGEFYSDIDAEDVMLFLDQTYEATARANRQLAESGG